MKKSKKQIRRLVLSGTALIVISVLLLLLRRRLEYIDDEGILHECFLLVPAAFLLILGALLLLLTALISALHQGMKYRR